MIKARGSESRKGFKGKAPSSKFQIPSFSEIPNAKLQKHLRRIYRMQSIASVCSAVIRAEQCSALRQSA